MLRFPLNRCFVLTAPGVSALATVRVAGPGVQAFLECHFSRRVVPGRPTHGELRDDAGVIDDPVVVLRDDGFAADLTLHGGSWITQCVIALAEAEGFERSLVDVETIGSTDAADWFEHELLVSLPLARTEVAARMLLGQRVAWQALLERPLPSAEIEAILADRSLEHFLHPPTLAIVGLPNAGKSTLANQLFGQQRSIVSPIPGSTRDWVGEEANLNGLIVKLLDTPGRRETTDAIERAAIDASDAAIGRADVVLLLLDASRDDLAQSELIEQFSGAILILNKSDERLPAWSEDRVRRLAATLACARTGDGIDRVIARIWSALCVDEALTRPRVWTERQRKHLRDGDIAQIVTATAAIRSPDTPGTGRG